MLKIEYIDINELKEYSNNAKMCNLSKLHCGGKW
jgi:hypothetical protein